MGQCRDDELAEKSELEMTQMGPKGVLKAKNPLVVLDVANDEQKES